MSETKDVRVKALGCPFCGGSLFVGEVSRPAGDRGWEVCGYGAHCTECGLSLKEKPTKAEAVAAWNRRAALEPAPKPAGGEWVMVPVQATEEMIEAGESALKDYTDVYMDGSMVVVSGAVEAIYLAMQEDAPPAPAASPSGGEVEPGWTARLAHVEQRTPIETKASDLKWAIECLGCHPLLTAALNAADLALRILGKWHDEGEPGASTSQPARSKETERTILLALQTFLDAREHGDLYLTHHSMDTSKMDLVAMIAGLIRSALTSPEAPQASEVVRELPPDPKAFTLDDIHVRLLRRGAEYKWIGLSDNAGIHVGEVVALGELERAGLVKPTDDDLPPGPPAMRPREITDAGRSALSEAEEGQR